MICSAIYLTHSSAFSLGNFVAQTDFSKFRHFSRLDYLVSSTTFKSSSCLVKFFLADIFTTLRAGRPQNPDTKEVLFLSVSINVIVIELKLSFTLGGKPL